MANGRERKIEQRKRTGELITVHESTKAAYEALPRPPGKLIRECCQGLRQHAYGFEWRYVSEDDLEEEVWLPHPTIGIRCSSMGRIERPNGQRCWGTLLLGYRRIGFKNVTGTRSFAVHRLIAETFHSNPELLPQVDHIDGDKDNNEAWNLRWVSPADNVRHAKHK